MFYFLFLRKLAFLFLKCYLNIYLLRFHWLSVTIFLFFHRSILCCGSNECKGPLHFWCEWLHRESNSKNSLYFIILKLLLFIKYRFGLSNDKSLNLNKDARTRLEPHPSTDDVSIRNIVSTSENLSRFLNNT